MPDLQFTLLVTRQPWLQQNRDATIRFLRAVIRGNRWLYDPANRAEAETILMQETGADSDTAAALYELYLREVKVYDPNAEPRLSHIQGNIDSLIEVQAMEPPGPRPEQYLDLGPLREAQATLATAR